MKGSCCPEPHHEHMTDEQAHRRHHWRERLTCLSLCVVLHIALDVVSHVYFAH